MIKNNKILVFDFETTGLDPATNEIIEIGAIRYEKVNGTYEVTDELQLILKSTVEISDVIFKITGITKEMQETEGVSQDSGFHQLSSLIDDETLLIAYNIQFDLGFLEKFYQRYYKPNYEIKNDVLDVMAVYKDRQRYPWKLEEALKKYNVQVEVTETHKPHRALYDVVTTFELLKKMAEEQSNIDKYVNVIGVHNNPDYRVPKEKQLPHVHYVPQKGGNREIEKL